LLKDDRREKESRHSLAALVARLPFFASLIKPCTCVGDRQREGHAKPAGDWVTETRVTNIEISDLTIDGNLA
jgi:hypothetical protein